MLTASTLKDYQMTDRTELQEQLIQKMLESMDFKTIMQLCYDYLDESYDKYSDNELRDEVIEYYPELLDDSIAA